MVKALSGVQVAPVQVEVSAPGRKMFCSERGAAVMASPLGKSSLEFAAVDGVDEKEPSGMAFNLKGDKFFVADRKKREVHSYDVSSTGTFRNRKKIIANMPDDPEFLVYTK